ncbi:hypothetical protein Ahy_A02g007649 isoform C [Arachis hypogaea]|uniref:Transposase MuDR plant domain-containing protein n=1 Tax=Arachis hypogaea TaxID=3818 RepID=A0A445ED79_ARAHY|nr:hypothetical protein Ahy_A02g007649 isoform C [Arachis hypogaea]
MSSDSEEDFEATYEAGDEEQDGDAGGVADPEDGEFRIGMEYSSRKSVVAAIRSYTIARGVDYDVYESERQTFYAKCKMYGRGCDWLIRASLIRKKGCWAIKPLVETDPSIKVKTIIAKVQSRFNYTISYRKAWLLKQKSIAKVFGDWEESYQALPWWLSVMVQKMLGSVVQIETRPLYNGNALQAPSSGGKYKGTLLVAVAQDGNQNIVPIAFALVEGETAATIRGWKSEARHMPGGAMPLDLDIGYWHSTRDIDGAI